jgi:hypothetical protein
MMKEQADREVFQLNKMWNMKVDIKIYNVINLKKCISKKLMIGTLNKVKNLINFSITKEFQYPEDHNKSQKV